MYCLSGGSRSINNWLTILYGHIVMVDRIVIVVVGISPSLP